jgi:hypothetical protein
MINILDVVLGRQVPPYLPDLLPLIECTPGIKTAKQKLPDLPPNSWMDTLKRKYKPLFYHCYYVDALKNTYRTRSISESKEKNSKNEESYSSLYPAKD